MRTLKEWKLKLEDLEKKIEGPGRSQVYTNIRWANGLTVCARDMEDKGGFALSEVYDALPCPVRELIRCEPHSTYKELTDAVLTLDISNLHDGALNYIHNEETARLARAPPSQPRSFETCSQQHNSTPHTVNANKPAPHPPYTLHHHCQSTCS